MPKSRKNIEGSGAAEDSAPQNVGDTTVGAVDRDRIAQRAYELYLSRGGGEGAAMDDWLNAERELGKGDGEP